MRRRPWPKFYRGIRKKLLLVAAMLLLLCVAMTTYRRAEALVAVYGEQRCRNLVTQLILDTVLEWKTTEKLITFTDKEKQSQIQLDGAAVTAFQANVGKVLTQKLDDLGEQVYHVPLGNILENLFFIGRGPEIAIRYIPIGAADLRVQSAMTDAGINQVLYRVTMTVSVDMTILAPGGTKTITCSQEVMLEEALLTGQVPLVYGS